jgi:hypothetical protein
MRQYRLERERQLRAPHREQLHGQVHDAKLRQDLRRQARKGVRFVVHRKGSLELYVQVRDELRNDLHADARLLHRLHGRLSGALQRELLLGHRRWVHLRGVFGVVRCMLQRSLRHDVRLRSGERELYDEVQRQL